MARPLSASMDAVMLSHKREPTYSIEVYDLRSTAGEVVPTTIGDVVVHNLLGTTLPTVVGPRDFTEECEFVDVVEVAGDYVDSGVAASRITFRIADPRFFFDPLENPAPADGRWLRQGNAVVVREGDASRPTSEWPITFTGILVGQPGRQESREGAEQFLTAKANSREVEYLGRINTSRNFAQNTLYSEIIDDLATSDMGLSQDELNLPALTGRLTAFDTTQFVQESPMVSISKLLFPDGFMPRFEGDGRLGITTGSISKAPTRIYAESKEQIRVSRPIVEENGANEVRIVGLDPEMSRVEQERQVLATASITTGFFSGDATIPVFWSDDRTQQALDVQFEVDASIEDGVFNFGGESFTNDPQSDGGSVGGEINVDGGLAQGIVISSLIVGAWALSIFVFDQAPPTGGPVAPVGRTQTVIAGQALFNLLASIGRGQYRVTGKPYEYVFQELLCIARVAGVPDEKRKELVIENHLINSQADCDAVAERVLRRERAKVNKRRVDMLHDLRLEPDDVFELGTGVSARRYMIQSIRRRLQRGGSGGLAVLDCFEVTAGVRP